MVRRNALRILADTAVMATIGGRPCDTGLAPRLSAITTVVCHKNHLSGKSPHKALRK
ncbi:hypothetical protein HMPREF1861_00310 [Corynebacterium kroppenstedtii]|nr:hypothetical protein HMPREF1861_00310 [Corynebacterium kroppenstedtii]